MKDWDRFWEDHLAELERSRKQNYTEGWIVYTVRHKYDNCYFVGTTQHRRMHKVRKMHHTSKRSGSKNPFHKALRDNHPSKFEWSFIKEFNDRKSANRCKKELIDKLNREAVVYNVLHWKNQGVKR